jgi:hypothetical protein
MNRQSSVRISLLAILFGLMVCFEDMADLLTILKFVKSLIVVIVKAWLGESSECNGKEGDRG